MVLALNLPAFDVKLQETSPGNHYIYCQLRQKYVKLTPEEWVRQHFVNYLISYLGYPQFLMANEVGITVNKCRRRCDSIVYDKFAHPAAIIEYKAPDVAITPRVFDQIVRYNMRLDVGVLMVSNGLKHYCCRVIPGATAYDPNAYEFFKKIPTYDELIQCHNAFCNK